MTVIVGPVSLTLYAPDLNCNVPAVSLMDSALNKDFWLREGAVERVGYDSNYNIYWSQENELRSWRIDEAVSVSTFATAGRSDGTTPRSSRFSRRTSGIARRGSPSATTRGSSSRFPRGTVVWRTSRPSAWCTSPMSRGTAPFGERSEQGNTLFLKFSYVF